MLLNLTKDVTLHTFYDTENFFLYIYFLNQIIKESTLFIMIKLQGIDFCKNTSENIYKNAQTNLAVFFSHLLLSLAGF